jgi:hypothetical protein
MLVGVLASTAIGCAGFGEGLGDRTGATYAGQPPTIEFACKRPFLRSEKPMPPRGASARSITVEADPDLDTVKVGELIAPTYNFPILISGPRPNAVLSRDVETGLHCRGLAADGEAPTAGLTLHVGITMLGTEWVPGHWYDLTRILRGHVVFRAVLRRDAETLWSRVFEAQDEGRYGYDLASNHEKLLSEAYCRCLDQFDQALDGPEFSRAVRGAAAVGPGS